MLGIVIATLLYLFVGLGWVILLEKLSNEPFERHEVIAMIALWPLLGPVALLLLALIYAVTYRR